MIKNIENVIAKSSENGISRIIIDHPKSYNSLSEKTIKSLIQVFNYYNKDEKTKVIIVEGSGKGFSAGHNLKEVRSFRKKTEYSKLFNLCSKLMLEIVESKKPVIAKVHGAAFAAGAQYLQLQGSI